MDGEDRQVEQRCGQFDGQDQDDLTDGCNTDAAVSRSAVRHHRPASNRHAVDLYGRRVNDVLDADLLEACVAAFERARIGI